MTERDAGTRVWEGSDDRPDQREGEETTMISSNSQEGLDRTGDGDPAEVPPGGDEPFTEEQPGTGSEPVEEDIVDEMSEESFPTSDPPSTWGGPDQP